MAAVPPTMPAGPPIEASPEPPAAWAPVPAAPAAPRRDPRVWGTLVFGTLSTIAAVFTSFSPWAHYADGVDRTGVEHGDGWFVVAFAFVAAGLCGAIAVGLRHLVARLALAGTGLAMFVVYLLNRVEIGRAVDLVTGAPLEVGGGLYGVAFAALGLVIASLAMPSRPWWGPRVAARSAATNSTST